MASRYIRNLKKSILPHIASVDAPVERMKKMRALNCSPTAVGMDDNATKRFMYHRWMFFIKLV